MSKINWIAVAAVLGGLAVALGAFGAHALKGKLDAYGESIYAKAVLYHMFHTMAIFAVGILLRIQPESKVHMSGLFFLAGIILFSGSLYVLAITGVRWLGMITPFGGLSFISGWILLALKSKI